MSDLTSKIEIGAGGYERPFRYDRITITSSDPEAARRCPAPELARAFATGPGDTSPRVDTYGAQHGHTGPEIRRYSADCSPCWYGFAHTTDHHDRAVRAAADARAIEAADRRPPPATPEASGLSTETLEGLCMEEG